MYCHFFDSYDNIKHNYNIRKIGEKIYVVILIILSIIIAKSENNEIINKSSERKAVLYSWGFVFFNGTSIFLNKIYVADYQKIIITLTIIFNSTIKPVKKKVLKINKAKS